MASAPGDTSPEVVVTVASSPRMRAAIADAIGDAARVVYLADLEPGKRGAALSSARALLSSGSLDELDGDDELGLIAGVGLLQLLSAGANSVPFGRIAPEVVVASNAGAYAGPMAEHVLALTLALAKRLPQNHAALARGEFDQSRPNLELRGSVVGILGYGGIGRASAELFRAFGARIHAIGRSRGDPPEGVEWFGTLEDLDELLGAADVVLIALPLTRSTRGLIGRRELSLMKPRAILVNPARAAILDEGALYEHMREHPEFSAGIDAWWHEPRDHSSFSTERPLFELPNLLGSPHNSAITRGSLSAAAGRAAENVSRFLAGDPPRHVVDRSEYLDPA
ncbi:MAG TPA: 2-hydroxyacid dehydrogenase [Solirubrobacteraceae bacterium]|nr:2-hydroxyacid dehydrogenase [Solirubrobacteraceae bacterium]